MFVYIQSKIFYILFNLKNIIMSSKKTKTTCPKCGSKNTYESNKLKQGHYLYCNHCGHEQFDD